MMTFLSYLAVLVLGIIVGVIAKPVTYDYCPRCERDLEDFLDEEEV